MQIKPILAALKKHRLATLLIVLEIALACAVLSNACFMIANRLASMRIDSGVAEASLGTLQLDGYDADQADDLNARMVSALRGIAGVHSVALLNSIPFGARRGTAGVNLDAAGQHFGGVVEFYVGGPGAFQTLGLRLLEGRAPRADDFRAFAGFMPSGGPVQVTRALARHLWPGADPIGKRFWMGHWQYTVVGVIEHLVRPAPTGWSPRKRDWSVFLPGAPGKELVGSYLLRADPHALPRVMRQARRLVAKVAPNVVLDRDQSHSLTFLRHRMFETDRAMAGLLTGVIAALLLVTALGIVGLASFWVGQRRRQIGVRRALGASRGAILRYFQTENFLIVTLGIAVGVVLAYVANLLLMHFYELPRLPLGYVPVAAVSLWALGQMAVLAPALRAAAVPPIVASRG
jgi:putative ABC transport system permease protein